MRRLGRARHSWGYLRRTGPTSPEATSSGTYHEGGISAGEYHALARNYHAGRLAWDITLGKSLGDHSKLPPAARRSWQAQILPPGLALISAAEQSVALKFRNDHVDEVF